MVKEIFKYWIPGTIAVGIGIYGGITGRANDAAQVGVQDGTISSASANPGYYACTSRDGSRSGRSEWDCNSPYAQAVINITSASAKILTPDFTDPTVGLRPVRGNGNIEIGGFTDAGKRFGVTVVFDSRNHQQISAIRISP